MEKDLHKRLEEAAEEFALKRCKREHIDETYSIYPTFFRRCKEQYFEIAEDVWKEAIKVAKEWLKEQGKEWNEGYGVPFNIDDFETDMNKLLEEKK